MLSCVSGRALSNRTKLARSFSRVECLSCRGQTIEEPGISTKVARSKNVYRLRPQCKCLRLDLVVQNCLETVIDPTEDAMALSESDSGCLHCVTRGNHLVVVVVESVPVTIVSGLLHNISTCILLTRWLQENLPKDHFVSSCKYPQLT